MRREWLPDHHCLVDIPVGAGWVTFLGALFLAALGYLAAPVTERLTAASPSRARLTVGKRRLFGE